MMMNIDVKIRNPYNNCILRKIIYHQYLPMLIGISDQMGAQTDRLRCEVCQNLILSPMNTGLLRYAVATALTVFGIETVRAFFISLRRLLTLQQPLPFTVLKRHNLQDFLFCSLLLLQQPLPFTVLKQSRFDTKGFLLLVFVATALTVYGMRRRVRDGRGAKRR